jgi:hypothetical protein
MGVPVVTASRRCSSTFGKPVRYGGGSSSCGRSSMAEPQPSKLVMRVRFPSPAPTRNPSSAALSSPLISTPRRLPGSTCPLRATGMPLGAPSRRHRAV